MKILILMLMVIVSLSTTAQQCTEYNNLSVVQKGRLEFAYHQGAEYDLGWTLTAIAYNESMAGRWRLNMTTGDVGLFQVNRKTAHKVLGITSHYKKLKLDQKLVYDDILNAYVALDVLRYFKKYHKGNWKKMVMSYNNGFSINTKKAEDYLASISSSVRMLKQCMKIY